MQVSIYLSYMRVLQANLDTSLAFWRISRETIFAIPFDTLARGGQTRAGAQRQPY